MTPQSLIEAAQQLPVDTSDAPEGLGDERAYLFRATLEAIADGVDDPQGLARAVLPR